MRPRTLARLSTVSTVAVLFAISSARADLGVPITPPQPLNGNASQDSGVDHHPRLANDGQRLWIAVWQTNDWLGGTIGTDGDILIARSIDNGDNWSAPVPLNGNASVDAASDENAQIVTDRNGNWVAVWEIHPPLNPDGGSDADILTARSIDQGEHWSAPAALNTNAATDGGNDVLPTIATDRNGNWVAAWTTNDPLGNTIGSDSDILFARSTDNGASWTPPAPLNSNAATDSRFDGYPRLAADGLGHWIAVWRSDDNLGNTIGNDADILVARSSDNGQSWSPPAPLNTSAATDSDSDFNPAIATDGLGNWIVVWESTNNLGGTIGAGFNILVARSTDNGVSWTDPAAVLGDAAIDSGNDVDVDINTDGLGNWVAVWQTSGSLGGTVGDDHDILAARSIDNGATWSTAAPLNTNAPSDAGFDGYPCVAADGHGNWVAAWVSNDTLGDPIGADFDILDARFGLPDCDASPEACVTPAGCGNGMCGGGMATLSPAVLLGLLGIRRARRRRLLVSETYA